jgi:hypothetical protein
MKRPSEAPPRKAAAKGSSKSRVLAEREDSVALQRATTVAVRLTACNLGSLGPHSMLATLSAQRPR